MHQLILSLVMWENVTLDLPQKITSKGNKHKFTKNNFTVFDFDTCL